MSLLFRPPAPLGAYASRVMMLCGLGMQAAVRAVCGLKTSLKWPNDLIFEPPEMSARWLKLAGMLSEVAPGEAGAPPAAGGARGADALVVGMGLNVNIPMARLAALAPNAGSLSALTGKHVSRLALLDALLCDIERRYDALLGGEDPWGGWRAQLAWLGCPVVVTYGAHVVPGTMAGVDEAGNLQLRTPGGAIRTFSAGDVSLRPL
jgi:BirA family biotin operon repressor/biotin-[acetyl-CoA-carboxylase] ligase